MDNRTVSQMKAIHAKRLDCCGFCEALKDLTNRLKYYKRKDPERYDGYKDEFYAALIHKVLYNGEPAGYSDSACFPLNYCPECGKDLRRADK